VYRWCSDRGGSVLGSVGLKALGLAGSATPRHSRVPAVAFARIAVPSRVCSCSARYNCASHGGQLPLCSLYAIYD
jgi:hypothetical protein